MTDSFLTVSHQVLILFLLIFLGIVCTKLRVLSASAVKSITTIVLYVVIPAVIIHSFDRPFNTKLLCNMTLTFGGAVFAHIVGIISAKVFLKEQDKSRKAVLQYGVIFSNAGFMALPLQYAVLGEEGVLYGAIFIAVFNIISWTYGVYIMSIGVNNNSLKKAFFNPGTVGTLIGVILFFTPLSLPPIISETLNKIAVMNVALPMMIIGYFLASTKNLKEFLDAKLALVIILRLIVVPAIVFSVLYFAGIQSIVLVVVMIATSTPTAANTVMFAELFERDVDIAAKIVSLSTLLSIITIPPIIALTLHLTNM
ncbi:MAG: hypothetical protein CR988_05715 [Treponema sp.]|nr:MAG: hypothetical protein CR988_05715 [Treponema sp.]